MAVPNKKREVGEGRCRQEPYVQSVANAVWGIHDPEACWIVALAYHVYYDASRTQTDPSGVLMVMGLLALESSWTAFEGCWEKNVLEEFHVPDVDMAKFEAGHKPYNGWSEEKREAFRVAIAEEARGHVKHLFGAGVDLESYRTIDAEYPISEHFGHGHPRAGAYGMAALFALAVADEWVGENLGRVRLMHMVEKGDYGRGALLDAADALALRGQVVTLHKKDPNTKERVRPFEASDALAWEARKYCESPEGGKLAPPSRQMTLDIMKIPGWVGLAQESDLRGICDKVGLPIRDAPRETS